MRNRETGSKAANASAVAGNVAGNAGSDTRVYELMSGVSSRREFLLRSAGVAVGAMSLLAIKGDALEAQQGQPGATNVEMTQDSYRPVWKPAKPDAKPLLDTKGIETLERQLACPCPCTLDVYTCRTTDFTCGISPAVHADVQRLVEGGYSADEIMAAMTDTYGDFILMTPRKQGFNLLAWFAPFAAVAVGAVGIGALLRKWRMNGEVAARVLVEANHFEQAQESAGASGKVGSTSAGNGSAHTSSGGHAANVSDGIDATPEELERLQAALRDDR